jgi:hypothetical protein
MAAFVRIKRTAEVNWTVGVHGYDPNYVELDCQDKILSLLL